MKKVIDGRMYNTGTAKLLGGGSNDCPRNDFHFWEEDLYRTKSGAYFLHGQGGAASRYAESAGQNSWCGGEKIIPLPPEQAREWAEEMLGAEEYAEIFGEPDEASDEREALNVSVPAHIKFRLDRLREGEGKTLSQVVEEILWDNLKHSTKLF